MEIRKSLSFGSGSAPSCPGDTCTFCSCIAVTTSEAVRPCAATLFGSSQTRIAYRPSQNLDLADAGQTRQFILHFQRGVVTHIE